MAPKSKASAAVKESAKDKKARLEAEAKKAELEATAKTKKRTDQANFVTSMNKAPVEDADKAATKAEYTALSRNDPQNTLMLQNWLGDCKL